MVSTAPDIVRFTRALFGGELLPADLLANMSTPGPHDRRYDGYGLGVERTLPDRQTLTLGHGGGLVGYGAVSW